MQPHSLIALTYKPEATSGIPKEAFSSVTALQRMGRSEKIAKTVLFLASEDASFITGTELVADGGYLTFATKQRASGVDYK